MGAGAGAAVTIEDIESSPRGAAIEKAQAELRQDLAVREERRRELEFLEKGGEILDFKFGETSSVNLLALSSTESPAHRLSPLKSEAEVDVVINGDLCKFSEDLVGRGAVEEGKYISVISILGDEEGGVQSCGRLGSLDAGAGDFSRFQPTSKPDVYSEHGIHVRPKSTAQTNRTRARNQKVVNSHALSKQAGRVVLGGDEVVELEGTVSSGNVDNEVMVDMSYQVLSHQNSHALSSKWNGLPISQEYEPVNEIITRCGPVLEHHATELSSNVRASAPSVQGIQSSDVRVGSCAFVTERDSDSSSLASEGRPDEPALRSGTHELTVASWEKPDSGADATQMEDPAAQGVDANSTWIVEDDVGTVEQATKKGDKMGPILCSSEMDVGNVPDSAVSSREPLDEIALENHNFEICNMQGVLKSRNESVADGSSGAFTYKDARILKKTAFSRGGSHLKVAHRGRAGMDAKKGSNHHLGLKSDEGVAEDRAKLLPTAAELGDQEINCAHSQELRTGAQVGAIAGGAPRPIERSGSNSGASNCMYPGVVLSWEMGQGSAIQSEADLRNADLTDKLANKAREDFILEKAEHLKAKRKLIEDRRTLKKIVEPSRRKSRWDFVLEEMRWMANDFWQERVWKRYQAAHVCLEIAMEKGEDEFLAARLLKEQRRISSSLAHIVKDFWHSAEVAATKETIDAKSSTKQQYKRSTNESGVMSLNENLPLTKEALGKSVHVEKTGTEQPSGILKYAVQLLKELGSVRIRQAEAPSTPERYRESNSILEQVLEVPLFYKIPVGAMETYRAAVEAEHAMFEEEYEKRRVSAISEGEAVAVVEASEDASAGGDVSYGDFSNDVGSQEDESTMFKSGGSRIAKKKRKKVFKTGSVGPRGEGSGLQGPPYRSSGALKLEVGLTSPVTGKRSIMGGLGPNNLTGSIPVKRQRSSATYLRPRGKQLGTSPGAGGLMAKKQFGFQSQHDDGLDLDDSSEGDINSDTPSSKLCGVDGKIRKKIKTKPYERLSSFEGGMGGGTSVKDLDAFPMEPRHEHVKRKADTLCVAFDGSDAVLGSVDISAMFIADTLGASGPQVVSGQQNSKKHKSLKHGEANSEAVLTSGLRSGQQLASVVDANKLIRQTSMRDSHRRVRPMKVPLNPLTGVGIPWSAGEDQAILALVHHLGTNWDLVSDVLSSNSQIKGIYRKPQQCKERHKALMERGGAEGFENAEDSSSSQLQAPKGIIRGSRGQSVAEEDALKHIEQIIIIVQKYGARKTSNDCKDQKVLQVTHPSHGITISQFCSGNGGPANPVQLADWVTSTGDGGGHSHPLQGSQGNVVGPQSIGLMPGLGMRPPAGGSPMNTINLPSEEAAMLRTSTNKLTEINALRAQQLAGSGASGVPVLGGLSNSNGLPSSTGGGVLAGLNRGVSLPRAGLGSMRPPVVSSMGTVRSNGRLPPSGNFVASSMTRRIAGLVNTTRSCTEEQRLSNLQQLQMLARQGETQAASALSSPMGSGDMGNATDGSNQHSLQQLQQQQEQHLHLQQHLQLMSNSSSKSQAQMQQHNQQLPGPPQAFVAVPTRMKEQKQQQQKQRLLGGLSANLQGQHMVVPTLQPAVPSFSSQNLNLQSHIIPPQAHNNLQKHAMQQVSGPLQASQVVGSAGLQSFPASPSGSGQQSDSGVQMPQDGTGGKPPQTKQMQKQAQQPSQQILQHQSLRNAKGDSKVAMLMQGVASQTGPGKASTSSGNSNGQLQGETGGPLQAGQRGLGQSQVKSAKIVSRPQVGSIPSGSQGGQGGQAHGVQSPSVSSVAGQQKESQQVKQAAQGGMSKPEQGIPPQAGGQHCGQQAGPSATSSQPSVSAVSLGGATQQCQQFRSRQVAQAAGSPRRDTG